MSERKNMIKDKSFTTTVTTLPVERLRPGNAGATVFIKR
jgi:hypothetical protein